MPYRPAVSRRTSRRLRGLLVGPLVVLIATLCLGCGSGFTLGEGVVTVRGLAPGQTLVCGQTGGQGQMGTIDILGSGFQSEHGVNVRVIFTATAGTPFDGSTSATDEVSGVVETDSLIVADLPSLVGTAQVTITIILPGRNQGVSVPGTLSIGGFLTGPFAFADRYSLDIGEVLTTTGAQGVLVNDFPQMCLEGENEPGPQNSPPSVTGLQAVPFDTVGPNGGHLVMRADGGFTYTPAPGFSGTETFTYTMDDGGTTDMATIFFSVGLLN